jgi:iron complex transport system ATP-binding protein
MLELRNIRFHYSGKSGRDIIDGVSLTLHEGELIALLGPNGSGKSTLLQVASGALHPHSGEVTVDGRPISRLTRREIARSMAIVAQSNEIRFPLTALEFVLTGRYAHVPAVGFDSDHDLETARDCLRETDALQFANRRVNELSAGERQRVSLARALAQQPHWLLLDEPTANADLAHQISMLKLVREMANRRRIGSLIVTHDLNLAAEFADRIMLLKEGRLVASGNPTEVMTTSLLSELFNLPLLIDQHPQSGRPRLFWESNLFIRK